VELLLEDYRDYLRQHGFAQWFKDDPHTQAIRKLAYKENRSYDDYKSYFEASGGEVAANAAVCLVFQPTFLLDRLIRQIEQTFIEKGGMSERMTAARLRHRNRQRASNG
jgi:four helix bundle suffix protein